METRPPRSLGRVVATPNALLELDVDGDAALTLPRADIRSVRLVHGQLAERPALLLVFGVALSAVALFFGVALARALLSPGPVAIGKWGAAVTMLVPGVWAIIHAARRGPFLSVDVGDTTRKVSFSPGTTEAGAQAFVAELRREPNWERLVRE